MPAEENERRDIPTHHKDPCRNADKRRADRADVPQGFRREEQGRRPIDAHESPSQRAEKDRPKDHLDLMPSELPQEQLNWEKEIDRFQDSHHTVRERITA